MIRTLKSLIYKRIKIIESKIINYLIPSGFYFLKAGSCPCCDQKVLFKSCDSWLRDNFLCSNCSSIPRNRALIFTIEKYYPDWKNFYIHESSPGGDAASKKLRKYAKKYVASHYYPDKEFGKMVGNFVNQNLEIQTFQDESFDLVITQDVMEHVYNPCKVFSEIARTLKRGGAYIFTVPIINKHKKTEIWAIKDDQGNPQFLKTAEWHGNPVDANGSPVTMHWGYDIINYIKDSCGLEPTIEYIDNLDYGIRAEYIEVIVCKKI